MKLQNIKFNIYNLKSLSIFLLGFLLITLLNSCYTFTGNSLNHDEKTILIKNFPNNAAMVNPTLSQDFTTMLQNRFLRNTSLKGATENADIIVEGEIVDYNPSIPTAISNPINTDGGSIQAAQNKLVITVKVHYENKKFPEASFDRTYTDEATFSSDLDINQIETSQVKIVNERIINKIFNDIVANW